MKKTSPNLEVISDGTLPPWAGERRRLPRLNLSGEQFRLSLVGRAGKVFSVTDLSTEGMALRILDREDFILFQVASRFEGILNLKGERFTLKGMVRHVGSESIGCEFENLTPEVAKALSQFLDPAALGRELKAIPSSESGTLWYHGPSGTDLLVRRETGSCMTLYVLGNYIQWTEEEGISTGQAHSCEEQSETRGIMRFETLVLKPDPAVDPGKLAVAKTLILSSNLAEELKNWCTGKLVVG
jgi:hypothetical protein